MSIVKIRNQSGILYAYEQTSVWDPEKKQARPKRKYLGRVDEETGEIIPTNGRGRKKKGESISGVLKSQTDDERIELIKDLKKRNKELEHRVGELEERVRSLKQDKQDMVVAINAAIRDYT